MEIRKGRYGKLLDARESLIQNRNLNTYENHRNESCIIFILHHEIFVDPKLSTASVTHNISALRHISTPGTVQLQQRLHFKDSSTTTFPLQGQYSYVSTSRTVHFNNVFTSRTVQLRFHLKDSTVTTMFPLQGQ
jgi:hypothetical protein